MFPVCKTQLIFSFSNLWFSSQLKGPRANKEKPCFVVLDKAPLLFIGACPCLQPHRYLSLEFGMLHITYSYTSNFNNCWIGTNDLNSYKARNPYNNNTNHWLPWKVTFIKNKYARLYPLGHGTWIFFYQSFVLLFS